jgi:hypothetical protein
MEQNNTTLSHPLQLRLPPTLREGLQRVARDEGNSTCAVARRLIANGLKQIEQRG